PRPRSSRVRRSRAAVESFEGLRSAFMRYHLLPRGTGEYLLVERGGVRDDRVQKPDLPVWRHRGGCSGLDAVGPPGGGRAGVHLAPHGYFPPVAGTARREVSAPNRNR